MEACNLTPVYLNQYVQHNLHFIYVRIYQYYLGEEYTVPEPYCFHQQQLRNSFVTQRIVCLIAHLISPLAETQYLHQERTTSTSNTTCQSIPSGTNHYKVVFNGNTVSVWVNDVQQVSDKSLSCYYNCQHNKIIIACVNNRML